MYLIMEIIPLFNGVAQFAIEPEAYSTLAFGLRAPRIIITKKWILM